MADIDLKCRCGTISGQVKKVTLGYGNRLVCYCDDCQAFPEQIGAQDYTLNEFGGTEIFQTAPANISIQSGAENLEVLRLAPKGIYRWYSGCCQTPIANSGRAKMPFVGLIHTCLSKDYETAAGPRKKHVMCQFAKEGFPAEDYQKGFGLGITLRVTRKLLYWKISGQADPHPFFSADGQPVSKPKIIRTV